LTRERLQSKPGCFEAEKGLPDRPPNKILGFAPLKSDRGFEFACPHNGSPSKVTLKGEHPLMSFTVTKVEIWSSKIEDRPGGLAKVLGALGNAGANLDCVIARRDPSKPGTGVVFLTPAKGAAVRKAAQSEGVAPAKNIATLKVEGDDAAGLGGRIATAIADAGINLRGVSAAVIGKKFVAYLGFDNATDASKATRALKKLASAKRPGKAKS
jgi:hypothetical protein